MGFGAIISDHVSRVEATLSKHFAAPLGMIETKVKAMEERVHFHWDAGIRDVVESDSMIVIDALMGSSNPLIVIVNIIERTRQKLQDFRSVQLSHIKR